MLAAWKGQEGSICKGAWQTARAGAWGLPASSGRTAHHPAPRPHPAPPWGGVHPVDSPPEGATRLPLDTSLANDPWAFPSSYIQCSMGYSP